MPLQTLNKFTADHKLAGLEVSQLDDDTLAAFNALLQEEFEATLVRTPGDSDDWAVWLVQEVPE